VAVGAAITSSWGRTPTASAAAMYSFVETAKLNRLDLEAYLREVCAHR
jgi:hypothetical protein